MTQAVSTVQSAPLDTTPSLDLRRLAAFCSPTGAEIFHSIVYHQEIWTRDPFDVGSIHTEAREAFHRLVYRAGLQTPLPGRILLLLGESGSGKTHLMRAFRNYVHANERGYCGYLQMTAQASNYAHYVLSNLIDALDQPFRAPEVQASGLMRLSRGLLDAVPQLTPEDSERFRNGDVDLNAYVENYANRALTNPQLHDCDLDLIRAMLYLQRNDPVIRPRIHKWLRCGDLSPQDRALIGHLVPRPQEHEPLRMIVQIGQLMRAVQGMPLVLLVDQLEDMTDQEAAPERFRRAMDTLVAVADQVPSSVLVIACLEDYFTSLKHQLPRSKLDRLEHDPEPVRLVSQRNQDEIEAMVARRVQFLYDEQDVEGDQPTIFPFTRAALAPLTNLRTRDVLDFCRRHREKCIQVGGWVNLDEQAGEAKATPSSAEGGAPSLPIPLEQAWNDFRSAFQEQILDDEEGLASLLSWAVQHTADELPPEHWFGAEASGRTVPVEIHGPCNDVDRLLLAVCEKKAQGGGLSKQIAEVEKQAGDVKSVLVRSTDFPTSTKTAISTHLSKLLLRGWRRVVVESADWRQMMAFREFHARHGQDTGFKDWVLTGRPLSRLASLRAALALDQLPKNQPAAVKKEHKQVPPPESAKPAPVPPTTITAEGTSGPLQVGTRGGLTGGPITMEPKELTQHAAFLGGSGSGKTTAALNLLEQLLERGIPAVLLDRKGDLCRYADRAAWETPLADPHQSLRRQRLRERLDVAVFTPGQPNGRPLSLSIVPDGLDQVPTLEREQLASYAAAALGSMLGYKAKVTDQSKLAILAKAIEVLGSAPEVDVTVPALRQLIDTRDEALLNAVGGFDDKMYKKLADELLTLWLQHKHLLSGTSEKLEIDLLLGRDGSLAPDKTRLSIISTRFLTDGATTDFWVAQLLLSLSRWIGKHPSGQLQAVFLFDEADQYLPALRQPATKAPMENLLKRARSAGIGLMLATQSPGDFDYKCRDTIRTWLVGKVKEKTALNKLKPMFAESKLDVAAKLPTQGTGQFYLMRDKDVFGMQSHPSIVFTEQLSEERILELAQASRITASG